MSKGNEVKSLWKNDRIIEERIELFINYQRRLYIYLYNYVIKQIGLHRSYIVIDCLLS